MMILNQLSVRESRQSILLVQTFELAQLIAIQGATTDLRWAMIELAVSSLSVVWASAQGRLGLLVCKMTRDGKARRGPCLPAADTMVAAGGR